MGSAEVALRGSDGKLYVADTGTQQWVEVTLARDVKMSVKAEDTDTTSRVDEGWKARIHGLKEWSAEFDTLYSPADTAWKKMRASLFAGVPIMVKLISSVDGEGIIGSALVMSFDKGEPLKGDQTTSISLQSNGAPTWTTS